MSPRRTIAAVTAIILAGALSPLLLAAPASAVENCDFGGFEIDGDKPSNCVPTAFDDWETDGPAFVAGTGATYSASSKDGNATDTWSAAGATPPKADIDTIASFTRIGANGHTYLYLAWTRENNTGTGKYAVELTNAGANVVPTGADDTPTPQPIRSAGGVVAYLQFQGADKPVLEQVCSYTGQANYPQSVNFDAACTPQVGGYAVDISTDGLFFEAGFDLTVLLDFSSDCPPTAVTAYLRGITGGSDNGNLKAYIDPIAVPRPSDCPPVVPDVPVLPSTGSSDSAPIGIGAAVLALTGILLMVRARRSRTA